MPHLVVCSCFVVRAVWQRILCGTYDSISRPCCAGLRSVIIFYTATGCERLQTGVAATPGLHKAASCVAHVTKDGIASML